jgi:hypothetical protein
MTTIFSFSELEVGTDSSDYRFEIKDPEFVNIDPKTGNVTALKEGETSVSL